jgi:uncharacterized protein
MPLSHAQGEELVRLARTTVDRFVTGEDIGPPDVGPDPFIAEPRGAFVTLKKSDGSLRGCIGFPYPVKALGDAIVEAAMSAAAYDPRFPRVEASELDDILVEVSALTKPEKLQVSSPTELPKHVRVGKDGLIVSNSVASGLLLPQVATEFNLQADDFLTQTCLKAGLSADAWLTGKVVVQRFQAEVFSETSPRGKVKRESD